jgi:Trk K+ transport system NAD-binding subunit
MLASAMHDHVILVGLGRLGYRTFLTLRRLGEPVVVIERDPNNQFLEDVRRDGAPLLIGDARREALLADASIGRARSIVLATDDDLADLETAMDARKLNGGVRVVLRLFDQNLADTVRDGFAIDLAMSQSAISAPTFASGAVAPATINSMVVEGEMLTMQRWLVRQGGPLDGTTVGAVLRDFAMSVVHHERVGEPRRLMPPPAQTLEPGDGQLIQGRIGDLERRRKRATPELAAGRSEA